LSWSEGELKGRLITQVVPYHMKKLLLGMGDITVCKGR
jgi:hypothetical protein